MTITEAVADRLGRILKERHIKKVTFKSSEGINGQSIANIFRTKTTKSISMGTLYRICQSLEMSMSEFLNDPIFDEIDMDLW